MDFKEIISNFITVVTQKYFCFEGRASRKSFWQYILVYIIVSAILNVVPGIGKYLYAVWFLALLCPTLGITARRLHDTGRTGWIQLLALIPVVGGLIVLFLCIPEGSSEANQYGSCDEK